MARRSLWNPLHLLFACALLSASCVNVDPETNEVLPRGDQRYKFDEVQRNAKKLKDGMTKIQVLMLLGSPAEKSERGNIWVYLPERAAVILPGRSLRLVFKSGQLDEHGYHAIVLGYVFKG